MERYLQQATRGLWGQKKREALNELRGAVEDKVYRHRLGGMSEGDATLAALRDLGSPQAIAQELSRVHTAPTVWRSLLLFGVTGLLGLQAVAQVVTVKSAFQTNSAPDCRLVTPGELVSAQERARYERFLTAYGGPQGFLAQCRAGAFQPSALLKVADLLTALKAGGVPVSTVPELTPTTPLMVINAAGTPDVSFQTVEINGGRYLESTMVIPYLTRATSLPLTLTGSKNPILRIGKLTLQLGTPSAPILAADLLAAALIDERRTNLELPLPVGLQPVSSSQPLDPAAPRLAVPGQDGDYFAVVQNILKVNTQGKEPETLWVRARQNGTLPFTDEAGAQVRLVSSPAELDRATASQVKAALIYRLEASNLHQMRLLPVPAAQARVIQP